MEQYKRTSKLNITTCSVVHNSVINLATLGVFTWSRLALYIVLQENRGKLWYLHVEYGSATNLKWAPKHIWKQKRSSKWHLFYGFHKHIHSLAHDGCTRQSLCSSDVQPSGGLLSHNYVYEVLTYNFKCHFKTSHTLRPLANVKQLAVWAKMKNIVWHYRNEINNYVIDCRRFLTEYVMDGLGDSTGTTVTRSTWVNKVIVSKPL